MLGKHAEAQAQLDQALTDAEPDSFCHSVCGELSLSQAIAGKSGCKPERFAQIIELGEAAERRKAGLDRPEALSALTEREYEIVG